jgi:hypothetical protein
VTMRKMHLPTCQPLVNPVIDDLRDFIEMLVLHQVEFLLVGGYAMAVHGVPGTQTTLTSGSTCRTKIR